MSHGDALKLYFVVLSCSNQISAPNTNLNIVEFEWNSVLLPNKCILTLRKMYTVTFGCQKNALEPVSAASMALQTQSFAIAIATEKNFVPKITKRLSLILHNIRKYKGFL